MSDDNTPDKDATEQPEGEPKDGEAKQPAAPRPRRTTAGRTTAPRCISWRIKPLWPSTRTASRTVLRDTPSCAASTLSFRGDPGASSPRTIISCSARAI